MKCIVCGKGTSEFSDGYCLRCEKIAVDVDAELGRALGLLGRTLSRLGRYGEARDCLEDALRVFDRMGVTNLGVSLCHMDLGHILTQQGRYSEAQKAYRKSLEVKELIKDHRGIAIVKGLLGILAEHESNFLQAERLHREAMAFFAGSGEKRQEATAWHQIGGILLRAARSAKKDSRGKTLAEAEHAFRESLRLSEIIGAKTHVVLSLSSLGNVAAIAGRYAEAEQWYRKASEDTEVLGPRDRSALFHNIAHFLLEVHLMGDRRPSEFSDRDLLVEAERYERMALDVGKLVDDQAMEFSASYANLANIAEARGCDTEARAWRQKARHSWAMFPGNWAPHAHALQPGVEAVVAAAKAHGAQDKSNIEELLCPFRDIEEMQSLSHAFSSIMSGERDPEMLAETYKLGHMEYLIIVKVLEALV